MFLTDEELLSHFESRLKSAKRLDLASAWATEGPALKLLEDATKSNGLQVRALVGLQHNITTPNALNRLNKIGKLRVVDDKRLFHAKVYLFHLIRDGVCWIGSANFTGKGFGDDRRNNRNEEVMFESSAIREVSDWFEGRWKEAGPLKEETLDNYRKGYRPPKRGALDERQPDAPEDSEEPEVSEGSETAADFLEPISIWGEKNPKRRLTPTAYIPAILRTLDELGGDGTTQEVLRRVEEAMQPVLGTRAIDYKLHSKKGRKEPNWRHQCYEARQKMAADYGLIEPDTVSGKWKLTREGTKASRGDYGKTWQRFAAKALK